MRHRSIRAVLLLLAATSGACATTTLTVRKVTPNQSPDGIRYSLPKPFVLVVPNTAGDGGFTTEVVYLPDECQTYAVDARTKRGKYQLEVAVKDGLLSKVVWNSKDSQAANVEGIRVGGEVLKSELARRTKQEEEERKERDEAQKAFKDALEKMQTDLAAKELEVELARAKVASAEAAVRDDPSAATRAALRAAELELQQEIIRRDAVQRSVTEKRAEGAELADVLDDPLAKRPQGETETSPPTTKFWGPVLYAIVEKPDTVELVAVDWRSTKKPTPCAASTQSASAATSGQKQLALNTVRLQPTKPDPEPPQLRGQSRISLAWPTSGTLELTLDLDAPFDELLQGQRTITRINPIPRQELDKTVYNALTDSEHRSVKVAFITRLAPGTYQLRVPFLWGKGQLHSVTLELEVEK